MIISVFSDGGKKDKIAELYDTKYPYNDEGSSIHSEIYKGE